VYRQRIICVVIDRVACFSSSLNRLPLLPIVFHEKIRFIQMVIFFCDEVVSHVLHLASPTLKGSNTLEK
jgi:hypothetical protein